MADQDMLYRTLTLARLGVHKRAWGYPNLDPTNGIEAYNICQIYEGQVSFGMTFSHLVAIRANTFDASCWKRSNSYRSLPSDASSSEHYSSIAAFFPPGLALLPSTLRFVSA